MPLTRDNSTYVEFLFKRELPPTALNFNATNKTFACLGMYTTVSINCDEDINPLRRLGKRQKAEESNEVVTVDARTIASITEKTSINTFFTSYSELERNYLALVQLKLPDFFAHENYDNALPHVVNWLKKDKRPQDICVLLGLDAADLIVLISSETLEFLISQINWLRDARYLAYPNDDINDNLLFPHVSTTFCLKDIEKILPKENSVLNVQVRIQSDSTSNQIANSISKSLRVTTGLFDYVINCKVSELPKLFIELDNSDCNYVTTTTIDWNHKQQEPSVLDVSNVSNLRPVSQLTPLTLPLKRELGGVVYRLNGSLFNEIEKLLCSLNYLKERSLIPGSRSLRYTFQEFLDLFRNNLDDLIKYIKENEDKHAPTWLNRQDEYLKFVSVLRREVEKRVASSMQSSIAFNTGSHCGALRLVGSLEAALRLYASTLQSYNCTELYRFLSVVVLDANVNIVEFEALSYNNATVKDPQQAPIYSFSYIYLNPNKLRHFGTVLYATLHEYSQNLILELQQKNSLTSHMFNQALVNYYAAVGFTSAVEADASVVDNLTVYDMREGVALALANQIRPQLQQRAVVKFRFKDTEEPDLKHEEIEGLLKHFENEFGVSANNIFQKEDATLENLQEWIYRILRVGDDYTFFTKYSNETIPPEISTADELVQYWYDNTPFYRVNEFFKDLRTRQAFFLEMMHFIVGRLDQKSSSTHLVENSKAVHAYVRALSTNDLLHKGFYEEFLELASTSLLVHSLRSAKVLKFNNGKIRKKKLLRLFANFSIATQFAGENREQPSEIKRNLIRWIIMGVSVLKMGKKHEDALLSHSDIVDDCQSVLECFSEILDRYLATAESFEIPSAIFLRSTMDDISRHLTLARNSKSYTKTILRGPIADLVGPIALAKVEFIIKVMDTYEKNISPDLREEDKAKINLIHSFLGDVFCSFFDVCDDSKQGKCEGNSKNFYDSMLRLWSLQYEFVNPFSDVSSILNADVFSTKLGG